MASQLRMSIVTPIGASVAHEPYSPDHEIERADEVDQICAQLAQEFSQRNGPLPGSVGAVRMKPGVPELVLCRIQDAQRYLQRTTAVNWPPKTPPVTILRKLLVETWRVYAQPYWTERAERARNPEASPLQQQKARTKELTEVIGRYFDLSGC